MPNLHVVRPADANETAAAWRGALERTQGPTAIVLTRQKIPVLPPEGVHRDGDVGRGAYVLSDAEGGRPDVLLLASGSEVHVALAAKTLLSAEGVAARVVSMPCWERFEEQEAGYRESVLPPSVPARVSVERVYVRLGAVRWETAARRSDRPGSALRARPSGSSAKLGSRGGGRDRAKSVLARDPGRIRT